MLNNYIFKRLSTDSVNSDPEDHIESVRARMNDSSLVASQLPPFIYTSLKTLLGETSNAIGQGGHPQWAINRIKGVKMGRKVVSIEEPENLPLIKIVSEDLSPEFEEHYRQACTVIILVQTDPTKVNSDSSWNIIKRIESLFYTYTESGIRHNFDIAEGVSDVKGFSNLTLEWLGTTDCAWDAQKALFRAHASVIQ